MNTGIGMQLRLAVIAAVLGLCGTTGMAVAQDAGAPPPPPPGGMMMHGPGGPGEALHGEIGEGRTVTGVPLSAEVSVTRDSTLSDGNRIHKESVTKLYRDSQGRIRREMTVDLATPTTGAVSRTIIVIRDPVSGKRYMLDPTTKTAREVGMRHGPRREAGPESPPPHGPHGGEFGKSVNEQNLGTKTINGFNAEGLRVTRTIPAGEIGNEKPIEVVTERWYSTDLQLPVLITHTDPMMGSVTTKLVSVSKGEPEASLFQVPPDYKIVSGGRGEPFNAPPPPR